MLVRDRKERRPVTISAALSLLLLCVAWTLSRSNGCAASAVCGVGEVSGSVDQQGTEYTSYLPILYMPTAWIGSWEGEALALDGRQVANVSLSLGISVRVDEDTLKASGSFAWDELDVQASGKAPRLPALAQLTEIGTSRYDLIVLANVAQDDEITTLRLTGTVDLGGPGLADDVLTGQWQRKTPDGSLVEGPWVTDHVDQSVANPEIPPALSGMGYADLCAHLSGPAGLPLGERNPTYSLHVDSSIAMDHVQVTNPDGTVDIVMPWTGFFGPGVDWDTRFQFLLLLPGLPAQGLPYTFAAVDAAGVLIPGVTSTDVWVGGPPPDPPSNIQARVVGKGLEVRWDAGPRVPGSFDPDRDLGFFLLNLNDETDQQVYGAVSSHVTHTIPADRRDFVPEEDYGKALNELPDGEYGLMIWALSVAPEGSAGVGLEYNTGDPAERMTFTIRGGIVSLH